MSIVKNKEMQLLMGRTVSSKWVNIELMINNKISRVSIFIVAILSLFQSLSVSAKSSEPLAVQIKACTILSEGDARLMCFDTLAQELSKAEINNKEQADTLPESLGGVRFDKNAKKFEINRGRLASCQKSHDGRWFFIFENGQVWKQVNHSQRHNKFKGCNFSVVIKKDGFGYKMHIEELSRVVRVKRHK